MNNKSIFTSITIFFFGTVFGSFFATIVIREAVPLRDHYVMIIISFVSSAILMLGLLFWYFKVVNSCKKVFGEKGGGMISSIMSFLLVSIGIFYLLVVSIFYMAIA